VISQAFAGNHNFVRSCADAMPGYVRCHALKAVPAANANGIVPFAAAPGGLNPVDLIAAYKLPTTGGRA